MRRVLGYFSLLASLMLVGCTDTDSDTNSTESLPAPAGSAQEIALTGENTNIYFLGVKESGDQHGGVFKNVNGTLAINDQAQATALSIEMDVASIETDAGQRLDDHLKSPDFFNVAEFPTVTFQSTSIEDGICTGDLTMLGETKSISFVLGVMPNGPDMSALADFAVNRFDFGMDYTGKADDPIKPEVSISVSVGLGPASLAAMAPDEEEEDYGSGESGGDGGNRRRGGGGRRRGGNRQEMFAQMDADGDGKLSGDEIPERLSDRIAEVDTDGDGAVSLEELQAVSPGRGGGGGRRGQDGGGDESAAGDGSPVDTESDE